VRVDRPDPLEQIAGGRVQGQAAGQHQRHLVPGAGQRRQLLDRVVPIAHAHHAVLAGVAPQKLSLDIHERVALFIDDEENRGRRRSHGRGPPSARGEAPPDPRPAGSAIAM
jgi:hypothetical protein